MSDTPSNLLTEGTPTAPEQFNISYAFVFARCNKEAVHLGPRLRQADIVQIIGPEHDGIETLYPTDDEVEIKNWKLIPCVVRVQYNGYWAFFKCKLQESTSIPMDFVLADVNPYVTQCRMKHMGADGNNNVLLWVNMTISIDNETWEYELCGKRIVGNEETKLDSDESRYVWEEELLMEW